MRVRVLTVGFALAVLAIGVAMVPPAGASVPDGRQNDTEPFSGGSRINAPAPYDEFWPCTTSFAVRKKSTGLVYMMTAGHCAQAVYGVTWRTGGGRFVGTNHSHVLWSYPEIDMQLIKGPGIRYAGTIYIGGVNGTKVPVRGASDPAVGNSYCISGAMSYEQCNLKVKSLSKTLCAYGKCTPDLVELVGGCELHAVNGDSGAPLILKAGDGKPGVFVKGLLIGTDRVSDNGCFLHGGWRYHYYAHKWSTIAANKGVAIVMG